MIQVQIKPSSQSIPIVLLRASRPGSPIYQCVSITAHKRNVARCRDLHLALDHSVNKLELSLSNLDDLLDQTGSNLGLELLDPANAPSQPS